jgi:hypothetical protein
LAQKGKKVDLDIYLAAAKGPPQSGLIGQMVSVPSAVLSGLLVAALLALSRVLWQRYRVPAALNRRVRRGSYLGAVRSQSERPDVKGLDVYAPRLLPVGENQTIARIQRAWQAINARGRVRVLTLDLEDCLRAGAELLELGIEVRVLPRGGLALGSEGLTFHLFEADAPRGVVTIINHHSDDRDHPERFRGVAPAEPYRARFDAEWDRASPLESSVSERILRERPPNCQGRKAIGRAIGQAARTLPLGRRSIELIMPHLAFRDGCSVIFVLGLPGSGKSYVRARLVEQLAAMRIETQSMSDYPYAYQDLLRGVLKLDPAAGTGYKAYEGGAFTVTSEKNLKSALQALRGAVREAMGRNEVVLVEFARADLATALKDFEDIRGQAQIIYVSTPAPLRQSRLADRVMPPEITVVDETITVKLSDNHLLPPPAERSLYAADGLDVLKTSPNWRDRIFEIDNEREGDAYVDGRIAELIDGVVARYQPGTRPARPAVSVTV